MTKEIRLSPTKVTLIDDEDFDRIGKLKWGFDGRYAYRKHHLRMDVEKQIYKKIYLHQVINNTPDGLGTDHINCDKLDNRRANLRTTTRSGNEANKPKKAGCSSKYKGVCWFKLRRKWKAEIKINGKKKHIGLFLSEEDAAKAYNKYAVEAFGEYARLNQI